MEPVFVVEGYRAEMLMRPGSHITALIATSEGAGMLFSDCAYRWIGHDIGTDVEAGEGV
jgi:hypothetical protein|nr:hypothetical protein [uncultured organism]AGU12106.1 hypothetical protein [uncultured organism]